MLDYNEGQKKYKYMYSNNQLLTDIDNVFESDDLCYCIGHQLGITFFPFWITFLEVFQHYNGDEAR